MRRLILRSHQSPGDILMLTAAVRDLHAAHPRQFQTDVRTSAPDLWLHNPHLTPLDERAPGVEALDMHYPLVHHSNQRPYHFLHGYAQYLEERLQVRVPVTQFRGDIHLSPEEREPLTLAGLPLPERYWIVMAGGKYDFTAKWWNPASYQRVVDHFRRTVEFIQCGEAGHWHPPLKGVTNLVGKTSIRQFVRLMHHAEGVVCPVTFAMHLAAAVPVRPQGPPNRACIVLAGGREPPHWEAYPTHQFLHTVGALDCCATGGCWKSRCQPVGDGDAKDRRDLCEQPVQVAPDLRIPRCLNLITAEDVIRRVEWHLAGTLKRALSPPTNGAAPRRPPTQTVRPAPATLRVSTPPAEPPETLFDLDGDLSTVVEFSVVLQHLRHYQPERRVSVLVRPGQAELLRGLCHEVYEAGAAQAPLGPRRRVAWSPCETTYPRWASTRATRYLFEELRLTPLPACGSYRVAVTPTADATGRQTLARLAGDDPGQDARWPIVVLDVSGDSPEAQDRIPTEVWQSAAAAARQGGWQQVWLERQPAGWVCRTAPGESADAGQAVRFDESEVLAAILRRVRLVVGQSSGPLRLAAAVSTPTLVVWPASTSRLDFDPGPRTTHLVPDDLGTAEQPAAQPTRLAPSGYRIIHGREVTSALAACMADELQTSPPPLSAMSITAAPQPLNPTTSPQPGLDPRPMHTVRFLHGLGDCANFAKLIPLYSRHGHRIGVECTPDKAIVFRAAGAEIVAKGADEHAWFYPPQDVHVGHGRDSQGSKLGWNISEPPLPHIGDKVELWPEYCASEVRVSPLIPQADQEFVARWLSGLPRPIVLLHTKGNSGQQAKSLPDRTAEALYREMIDRFEGTLVLLDWDNRVPRLAHYRVRHLNDMGEFCTTERLFALFDQADLFVGVDSGPLHAASLSEIPRVGVWMPTHYPSRYSLPHPNQLNLVLAGPTGARNRYRRVPWNLVEQPGHDFDAAWLAEQVVRMLQPPRYLPPEQQAADVQLQQWIGRWCRGPSGAVAQGSYADRHRSFDALFREAAKRFSRPMIVETGTIRAEEDWGGAGFFTYLAGAYALRTGGKLHSVDLTSQHCEFARTWTQVFGEAVTVHCQDSLAFLREFRQPIDVLYLDSLDTYEPGHAEHALRETQFALPSLHERSLILFDDTPSTGGKFTGKGALAVPWLLERGWQLHYAGYQVLLQRSPS